MRAFLFASATQTTFLGRRSSSRDSHGEGAERVFRRAGLTVVGTTTDPSECLVGRDAHGPLTYVVDHTPGNTFGAPLITALIKSDASRCIVAYSVYEHLSAVAAVYEAGAAAFVSKKAPARDVLEVICAVGELADARDRHFPGNLAEALAKFYLSGGRASHPRIC